jgi:hypothetical protein
MREEERDHMIALQEARRRLRFLKIRYMSVDHDA